MALSAWAHVWSDIFRPTEKQIDALRYLGGSRFPRWRVHRMTRDEASAWLELLHRGGDGGDGPGGGEENQAAPGDFTRRTYKE